ncbi:GLPGLI family protein [uncultured Lacinutrix sp.]|uniref:GLPGLI family protein n=1 Tax=uncultured Lacinutrix sp. TaxID=574032 RepID=UPI00262B3E22|nr:GLPGLI family protein [uncultured Lacinutrix sp.]
MKRIILLLITFIITGSVFAQDFQGVATYKSHRKLDFKMDDANIDSEMQKQIAAQLVKQFQQEYTLVFTKEESIYKQNKSLAAPSPKPSSGISITVSGNSDVTYKNIKENRYTRDSEVYGKRFLIKDSIEPRKWELVKETKSIGEYICNKAIFKEKYETKTMTTDGNIETVEKDRVTTAWYTMQIPVNNGPGDFQGLPGLILEINDGELTLVCSKLVLNPKEKVDIVEPKKGKVVTQEKFEAIMDKKSQEMMEQFHGRGNDGSRSVIRIGG